MRLNANKRAIRLHKIGMGNYIFVESLYNVNYEKKYSQSFFGHEWSSGGSRLEFSDEQ